MVEIISSNDVDKWNEIISSMCDYDFYHLSEYHNLDTFGKPLLFHYENKDDSFTFPLILRNIDGTNYYDVTSVYGYAGPLTKRTEPSISSIQEFQSELMCFFDSYLIISAFSRLHPLFGKQAQLLNNLGDIHRRNHTIGIDLQLSEEEQRIQYSRSLKNTINRLKRKGVEIIKASTRNEIDSFIEMYIENMERVSAPKMYFFSKEYFYQFLETINSFILLAIFDGQTISGTLCTICNGIMQAHLNATKDEFLDLSPLKLVLEQARIEGIKNSMDILHLGGGRGGVDDSLYVFKSRFSHLRYTFKTWEYIHNQKVYDYLVSERGIEDKPTSFFPLYRK